MKRKEETFEDAVQAWYSGVSGGIKEGVVISFVACVLLFVAYMAGIVAGAPYEFREFLTHASFGFISLGVVLLMYLLAVTSVAGATLTSKKPKQMFRWGNIGIALLAVWFYIQFSVVGLHVLAAVSMLFGAFIFAFSLWVDPSLPTRRGGDQR